MVFTVDDHQGGGALDAIADAQVLVVVGDQLLIGHTGLGQQLLGHPAVGAGDPAEQQHLTAGEGGGGDLFLHGLDLLGDGCGLFQHRSAHIVHQAILELLALALVPVLHRAVVAGDAAVDLGLLAADGAAVLLAGNVAVVGADGIGGAHGVVRQLVVLGDLPHQSRCSLPVGQFLTQEGMEYGAGGIAGLKLVLDLQGGEDILGIAHGQVGGIGVVGGAVFVGGDDLGETLLVVLGEAIGSRLGGGSFQVIQVAVLFLVVRQALPHMIQHFPGKFLGSFVGQIGPQPLGVEAHLVHTDETDGREVVGEGAQVPLGVGIQAVFHQTGDDLALGLKGPGSNVHQLVQADIEILLVSGQVGDAGQVDGDHADGAGGLTGAKEAAGLFPQLSQI